jgi:hypothetical protein
MNAAGNDVQGMFSNDIVGASRAFDGTKPDPFTLRLFVEGVPTAATANDIALLRSTGGENDSKSRQLGRFVTDAAPFNLTMMNVRTIWRRDRFLRASDHVSFESLGYPAARFTEPRENFNHEHQDVRVVNGVQFGDLIDFVDFAYIARVTAVNAATVWALATAPRHAQKPANPHHTARRPPWHQPDNSHLERQPRIEPGQVRGSDQGDHRGRLDQHHRRRQRDHHHARHLEGQRAVRPPRRRHGRQPQPGRLPGGGGLTQRTNTTSLLRGQPTPPSSNVGPSTTVT